VELDLRFAKPDDVEATRGRIMDRFERIGSQIMNRTGGGGGPFGGGDPLSAVLSDPKKRQAVAQLLGQAYVTAYALICHNREKVERIADVLMERREMHGDEVVEVLDSVRLEKPEIDLMDEKTWPKA
jgi:hypothetical protein